MHGPVVVGWLLVALGAGTGLYCLAARPAGRDEAVMGLGMAAMAVPVSVLDPAPWGPPLFAVLFGAMAVRALLMARTLGHHAHHAVGAAAMAYMAVAMVPGGHAHAHAMGGVPLLTGVLLLYFTAYVLAAGARLAAVPVAAGPATTVLRAPELAAACRVSMALGMCAMLLTL
jgi:hypothetical protein